MGKGGQLLIFPTFISLIGEGEPLLGEESDNEEGLPHSSHTGGN